MGHFVFDEREVFNKTNFFTSLGKLGCALRTTSGLASNSLKGAMMAFL
jgi:hypothetical protein